MARYLVTGGAGFVGSHLVRALRERGDRVRVLDDLSSGRRENLPDGEVGEVGSDAPVELLVADVTDGAALAVAVEGCDGVLHEAAQVSVPKSVEDPERSLAVNALGTLRLLEAMRASGCERIVLAASSAAYGDTVESPKREDLRPDPLSPYAVGKLAAEHLLASQGRLHGLRSVSLRYFNVFGPRQVDDSPYTGVIAIFARALLEGLPVTIHGDGEQTRDFTFVDNVVDANLRALEADLEPGTVLNVGGDHPISINQLFAKLAALAGSDATPSHGPARAGDVRDSHADLSRTRALLGWDVKVPLDEGLARTFAWYRERHAAAAG